MNGERTEFASVEESVKRCAKSSPQHAFVLQHQIGSIMERCLQIFEDVERNR